MPEVVDGDGSSSFAFVLPVQPGWADSLASVTLAGPGGTVMPDRVSTVSRCSLAAGFPMLNRGAGEGLLVRR